MPIDAQFALLLVLPVIGAGLVLAIFVIGSAIMDAVGGVVSGD